MDFDPGPGTFNLITNAFAEVFVSKLDRHGDFVWAKRMGGIKDDVANAIAVDGNGNVLTTGIFRDSVEFDPGPGTFNLTSIGSSDISSPSWAMFSQLASVEPLHFSVVTPDIPTV